MPRKKTSPVTDPDAAQLENDAAPDKAAKAEKPIEPEVTLEPPAKISPQESAELPDNQAMSGKTGNKNWLWIMISLVTGLAVGYVLCYNLFVIPLNRQLSDAIQLHTSGAASSNQIKSDFSNMQLRQQEMEIRYLKSAAQLENANLYIFLLQMKEKATLARLYVEQKNGLEARETLAEIKTLYNNIYPFIEKKDKASADELDVLISTAVQDLTADPETASLDLDSIYDHLSVVEAAIFKME